MHHGPNSCVYAVVQFKVPSPHPHFPSTFPRPLDLRGIAMVRRPYASDTLVNTLNRLVHPLVDHTSRVPQQLNLVKDLVWVHTSQTHGSVLAVDIMCDDCGMFLWSGRHGNLDLGVTGGELWEMSLKEGAKELISIPWKTIDAMRTSRMPYFMPLELPAQSQ